MNLNLPQLLAIAGNFLNSKKITYISVGSPRFVSRDEARNEHHIDYWVVPINTKCFRKKSLLLTLKIRLER